MITLAVETSCDDTSCALIADNGKILSSIVSSQNPIHAQYGGVVPEIASRQHLENISPVFDETLKQAAVGIDDIGGICATLGPGLVGSLLVGIMFAKGLAISARKPFFGVNHIEGHFFASFLSAERPEFPFIALVASGGHTALYLIKGFRQYTCVGQTRDDAAGEAFDKVAKLLGLGYPGGVAIQNAAGEYAGTIALPKPLEKDADFSFSGLKTAVLNIVRKQNDLSPEFVRDIAASFQRTVVEIITDKTLRAATATGVRHIVISGGVSANRPLRKAILQKAADNGLTVFIPAPELCTDNAAMIGVVGHHFLSRGETTPLTAAVEPDWML